MEEVTINPTRTYTGLEKQTLGGHKQNVVVCTRIQEKGAVTPKENDPDFPVNVQESPVEAWVSCGLLQGRGTDYGSACRGPLKEVAIFLITSTIVWSQVKQGGNTAPIRTENWVKDLLSITPPIIKRPTFPITQSLPSRNFSKPLILLHERAGRLKTTITGN